MPEPGWFDVAGGKLTTYRLIAEQVIDRIAARTGRPMPPSRTAEEPLLPPGEAETAGSGILPPPVSRELVDRYCRQEWAVFPEDIMLRRAGWQHYLTTADAVAGQVAEWMREGP
jgi:glycerol-3-phosphate dehydrogenase